VTATFYSALHAIDALLAHDNNPVTNHERRNRVLRQTNKYLAINQAFLPLCGLSRTVRYLARPEQWVSFAKIESGVLPYLYKIENSVFKLLKEKGPAAKIQLQEKEDSKPN